MQELNEINPTEFQDFAARFPSVNTLVIGDLALDEFISGMTERISREAPVPIIRYHSIKRVPGGAGNTTFNLKKLGAKVSPLGIIGEDTEGVELMNLFRLADIETELVFSISERQTTTKTRISAHSRQSVTQQIVRIDKKNDSPPPDFVIHKICSLLPDILSKFDVVICSDYGDGIFAEEVIKIVLTHPFVIVDAQKNLRRFRGAKVFTPNVPEAVLASGLDISNEAELVLAAEKLIDELQAEHLLITRGEDGMSLFEKKEETIQHHYIPPFNRTEVFDVTGAGDTVVSVFSLMLASGASPLAAAQASNIAAGLVVRKTGTATVSIAEIIAAIPLKQ